MGKYLLKSHDSKGFFFIKYSFKKTWVIDTTNDGLNDYFNFEIIVPLLDNENIYNVRVAFELEYVLSASPLN